MLKAVHSPRRAVDFVRISFEKLTNPRLKWLAALVKFKDGKEFEPKGNAFQVKGALSNAATLASLNRWPQCVSVFMSGSPRGRRQVDDLKKALCLELAREFGSCCLRGVVCRRAMTKIEVLSVHVCASCSP